MCSGSRRPSRVASASSGRISLVAVAPTDMTSSAESKLAITALRHGIDVLGGSFFQSAGARLELSYADGTSADIPFVWVAAPIDAGFYLFRVPDAHRVPGHRPTEISLFDDGSEQLARRPPRLRRGRAASRDPPGYPNLPVPAEAVWEQRQQLFDLRADDGARIGAWVAPERGGGTCFWTNQAMGCSHGTRKRPLGPERLLGLEGFSGEAPMSRSVAGLGFSSIGLKPASKMVTASNWLRESYLVWPIPSRHFPLQSSGSKALSHSTPLGIR